VSIVLVGLLGAAFAGSTMQAATSATELERRVLRAHERFRKGRVARARAGLASAHADVAPDAVATAAFLRASQALAALHVLAGDPEAAVPVLDRAIALETGGAVPIDPFRLSTSRVNLAAVHACAGRWERALALLDEAATGSVDPTLVQWSRARALHELGRVEEARAAYRALRVALDAPDGAAATYRVAATFDLLAFETDHGNLAATSALGIPAAPSGSDVPHERVRCWTLPVLIADAPLRYRRPGSVDRPADGDGRVRGTVGIDGRVHGIEIVDEDGLGPPERRDARAAADAFRAYRFLPALADGYPVPHRTHPLHRRPAGVAGEDPR
jgi:tetratricopeptide (TPR) repeat protein